MSSQFVTSSCTPTRAAVSSTSFAPDSLPCRRLEVLTRCRHSQRHSYDMESVRHDHHTSLPRPKKDRRSTFSYGPARPPLNPYSDSMARILPQRIITPGSTTTGVESIWFQSIIEHPYFGVSLADIVDDGVEKPMIAPEERVFLRVGLKCEEIQFSILWPGYGHTSWIASIPIDLPEGRDCPCGPITRRSLASAVAKHFRAFMTNHSYLRFPHPDPNWRIMNERQNGISFGDLRLTRLFSHRDGTGGLGPWQAEILVVYNTPAYAH